MDNHFEQFLFHPRINQAIESLAFKEPTDIQKKAMSPIIQGHSVIGQSQTGSGKTHAYLLPLMNNLDSAKQEVQIVVIAPTQELAIQIYDEIRTIIHYAEEQGNWIAKLLVSSTDKQKMENKLNTPPHIIVGTPGRVLDFINRGSLSIYSASAFVIDEADLLLELGMLNELDQLLVRMKRDIQILAFSATIPKQLEHFYKKYLDNPMRLKSDDDITPSSIDHRLIAVKHRDRSEIIYQISQVIQPYLAFIFTNGKEEADLLAGELQQKGIEAGLLHGNLSSRERKRTFKDIRQLRYQYVVVTDLASRGIDIKGVSHIINAQMPKETEFYVHRAGRTARGGLSGTVISLYDDQDKRLIEKVQQNGVEFSFWDIKNGEWKYEGSQKKRNRQHDALYHHKEQSKKKVKKPKKVKPGYKKKMKKQINKNRGK